MAALLTTADDASTLIRAVVAFVAHTDQRSWSDVRITDNAFAVAFLTQPADGNAWLLAAAKQVRTTLVLLSQIGERKQQWKLL